MHTDDMAAKNHQDRMSSLAGDLGSPRVLTAIDKALEEVKQEWLDLWDLRKSAVRRHGDTDPAPIPPMVPTETIVTPPPHLNAERPSGETLANLAERYLTDERSPYHSTQHATRSSYDRLIKRLIEDCGEARLADLKVQDLTLLYEGWSEGGIKVSMGHSVVTMLRGMVNFGASILEDSECVRLSVILRTMRFATPKARNERLTEEHARAIIQKAHEMGHHSIALAQAFQFECKLRQKEVIGEWVPLSEPDLSDVTYEGTKWIRGLRWEEIDTDLVLRHTTSKKENVEVKLIDTVMVFEELRWRVQSLVGFNQPAGINTITRKLLPSSGPVICSERHNIPWDPAEFRRIWRNVATAAGVPKAIRNSDSRSGAESAPSSSDDGESTEKDRPASAWQPAGLRH